jgi:uncharacterized protein YerC
MEAVISAILALESAEECSSFVDAMFTPQELEQLPVRWGLLMTLMSNKLSQRKLAERASVAPATAARAHTAFQRHEALLRKLCERIASQSNGAAESPSRA